MRVLVVEDDPGILRTVADNLRFDNHEVVTAMDGETAYLLQQQQQPDLIVLDLMLPRMSGLSCAASCEPRTCRLRCWC
jgi:DNA-binding response OmpR family regulator